jgi:hypothetical protein
MKTSLPCKADLPRTLLTCRTTSGILHPTPHKHPHHQPNMNASGSMHQVTISMMMHQVTISMMIQ